MGDVEAAPPAFGVTADELVACLENRDAKWLASKGGPAGLAKLLASSRATGISGAELGPAANDEPATNAKTALAVADGVVSANTSPSLRPRIEQFGVNKFKYPPPKSFLTLMVQAFKDVTIIILSIAAIVSLTIGVLLPEKRDHFGYLEGVAIVLVVLVVVLVQAGIDYQKEQKFRQLNSVKDSFAVQAVRAGHTVSIVADDVLVGDVLKVSAGDKIAADAILLDASSLRTNESAMTGEVIDISKTLNGDPFLLSGTTVSEGVGHILVVAVGERSQWGVILSSLIVEAEDTPLQQRLNRLAISIGKLGLLFASLTFVVSMVRWGIRSGKRGGIEDPTEVLEFFIDVCHCTLTFQLII
jgi:P-type Ca2+ transporter type 2C